MRKSIRKRTILMTIGAVVCICSACGNTNPKEEEVVLVQEEENVMYSTAIVEYGEVVESAKITCKYTPTEYEELAFGVDDRLIERVEVKKGDIVTKGDLLASADVEDLEDTIWELEYQIKHQTMELKHVQELKKQDIETENTLYVHTKKTEEAKEDHEEALLDIEDQYHDRIQDLEDSIALNQKRLMQYQEDWDGGRIIAGISGEVTYVAESLEDTYSDKDIKVATISNLESCYFIADEVTRADFFAEGETYELVYQHEGEESLVEVTPVNMEQWETQMFFKPVNEEIFEHGDEGNIYMELGKKDNVLYVPKEAVHETTDSKFVYVVENELIGMRYVETGLEGEAVTEIVSGLSQGEIVVIK